MVGERRQHRAVEARYLRFGEKQRELGPALGIELVEVKRRDRWQHAH